MNKIDVRSLKASATHLTLSAAVPDAALSVGIAVFEVQDDGRLVCDHVHVEPGYRRRGIATALYAAADAHFKRPPQPSMQLTSDSVAFHLARGATIPPGAEVKTYAQWFGEEDIDDLEFDGERVTEEES